MSHGMLLESVRINADIWRQCQLNRLIEADMVTNYYL